MPGYAAGGLVTNGLYNRDSVTAALAGGEYVLRAPAVRELGPANLAQMNASGRMPGEGDVVQAAERIVAALREEGDLGRRQSADDADFIAQVVVKALRQIDGERAARATHERAA